MTDSDNNVYVDLGTRSYNIGIGTGTLDKIGGLLATCCPTHHAIVITHENVEHPHAMTVAESVGSSDVQTDVVVIPVGETSKSIDVLASLWEKCLELETDRKSVIVAVGGGVIGDLAGFVAASFTRGLRFVQVPTTLLAQVDSSVGGKVGINLPGAKNMVGAFWQPAGVLIDTSVLDTLPAREYRAGLAEVVKYGVILDAEFFDYLEQNITGLNQRKHEVLVEIIQRSCQLKANVVQQDEREESGLRAVLNYGHTFCHALEAVIGYGELLHGEGVAIGMLCASRLAERLGRVDAEFTSRQANLLAALGLPTEVPSVDPGRMLETMRHDKKVESGRLRFALPTKMGHVELVSDIDDNDVRAALDG